MQQPTGRLSSQNESSGNPGAISYDQPGGWSYGSYQIATVPGTFAAFLEFARHTSPDTYAALDQAGGLQGATVGTAQFKAAWQKLAQDDRQAFARLQYGYIVESHYGAAVRALDQAGYPLEDRSQALAEVIFSLAVAAGPGSCKPNKAGVRGGCAGLIYETLKGLGRAVEDVSDRVLVAAIYDAKLARIDQGREYARQPGAIRESVRKRFAREKLQALALIEEQQPKVA